MSQEASNNIAFIPTRGGSEGLPSKNILPLCEKPMLNWTLEAAQESDSFSQIVVSTDSEEIGRVAEAQGVSVYFHPSELSESGKPTFPVIQHYAQRLESGENLPDAFVTMRATSPTRTAEDIRVALEMFFETGADSVLGMECLETCHPIRLKLLDEVGRIVPLQAGEENSPIPRQQVPNVYRRNGAIYVTKPQVILEGSLFGTDSRAYVMSRENSVNVNDEFDFWVAECVLKTRQELSI